MKRNKVKLPSYSEIEFYIDEQNKDEILNVEGPNRSKNMKSVVTRA